MAMAQSHLADVSPEVLGPPALPSPPSTLGTRTPPQQQQQQAQSPTHRGSQGAQQRRQQRHSKRLSLNFPILIPARGVETPDPHYSASPTALSMSNVQMAHNTFFSPPSMHASNSAIASSIGSPMPLTPPSEEEPGIGLARALSKSKAHGRQNSGSGDFLTMLASQERKVLELKEELVRAETELTAFKKQWAQFEAGKKKNESKGGPNKMGPGGLSSHARATSVVEVNTGLGLMGVEEPLSEEKLEAERERRREMVRDRMMGRVSNADPAHGPNGSNKKNGQRVFSSSRHTRTLSLLATTSTATASSLSGERAGPFDGPAAGKTSLDATRQHFIDNSPTTSAAPALVRANTGLDGINLGRTYKDLANASRKNLPPGLSPEQFVKTGKQVVDGVRDGLWNFFEDIRQATVGEEPINGAGAGPGVRRQTSTRHANAAGNPKLRRSMTDGGDRDRDRTRKDATKDTEPSFWKEFGVDTPKTDKARREHTESTTLDCPHHHQHHTKPPNTTTSTKTTKRKSKHPSSTTTSSHESKSSTDSSHPPSLVADLLGDEDDSWENDNWDTQTDAGGSPRTERKRVVSGRGAEAVGVKRKGAAEVVQWHDLMS